MLLEISDAVNATEIMALSPDVCEKYKNKYRDIIKAGEQECPLPSAPDPAQPKRRGSVKKSKSGNLPGRPRDFENEALKFMI